MLQYKFGAPFAALEIKRGSVGSNGMTFGGYGAVFGNIDSYGDVIAKGAFSRAVAASRRGIWPAMLLQHGGFLSSSADLTPIGIWTSMSEDSKGLAVTGKLADTSMGRTIAALLSMQPRPALSGLSIGFRTRDSVQAPDPRVPKGASRLLTDIDLAEISPVTFPANDLARIDAAGSGLEPESTGKSRLSELPLPQLLLRAVSLAKQVEREQQDPVAANLSKLRQLLDRAPAGGLND
jgi:hypothetical protein